MSWFLDSLRHSWDLTLKVVSAIWVALWIVVMFGFMIYILYLGLLAFVHGAWWVLRALQGV